jgi:hypothetical protein
VRYDRIGFTVGIIDHITVGSPISEQDDSGSMGAAGDVPFIVA